METYVVVTGSGQAFQVKAHAFDPRGAGGFILHDEAKKPVAVLHDVAALVRLDAWEGMLPPAALAYGLVSANEARDGQGLKPLPPAQPAQAKAGKQPKPPQQQPPAPSAGGGVG